MVRAHLYRRNERAEKDAPAGLRSAPTSGHLAPPCQPTRTSLACKPRPSREYAAEYMRVACCVLNAQLARLTHRRGAWCRTVLRREPVFQSGWPGVKRTRGRGWSVRRCPCCSMPGGGRTSNLPRAGGGREQGEVWSAWRAADLASPLARSESDRGDPPSQQEASDPSSPRRCRSHRRQKHCVGVCMVEVRWRKVRRVNLFRFVVGQQQ